jgi:hypothetical protein
MTMLLDAYCILCKENVVGKLTEMKILDSGKWLHVGECPNCAYEIKRIMPLKKENGILGS